MRSRVSPLLVAAALAAAGCNTSWPAASEGQPDAGAVTCVPLRSMPRPSAVLAAPQSCKDAGVSEYSPAIPPGLAYPDVDARLPDHVAYLTFDDGPSEWTNDFLDLLKARGVRATFFVTGKQFKGQVGLRGAYVDQHGVTQYFERLLKRELDEGHILANHTVNHPDLGLLDDDQVEAELAENELEVNAALLRAGAHPVLLSLFRPPMGSPWFTGSAESAPLVGDRPRVAQRIAHYGLNVLWNISSTDAQDWAFDESYSRTKRQTPSPNAPTFKEKVDRVRRSVLGDPLVAKGDGIIVLMHDTHNATLEALPSIIDGLVAAGYEFATIEDLVISRWGRPSRELTPGPALYSRCAPERSWGCEQSGETDDKGNPLEICGRIWSAYQSLDGARQLGKPLSAQRVDRHGIVSQAFELGTLELHPENPAPCNALIRKP